ncbi:hypothetical protein, partial [Streptomyces europaeiscabiei]|uniref:hypothetical protein n=1 Tax=Streptomyces europaeiscabiei TaxID=146819 RepID=UPI0038F70A8C
MRVRARDFAADRAAEMVGAVRYGQLVMPNPSPEWTVADATKDMIRDTVGQALKEGWSPQKLGKAIRASAGFSATRA